MKNLKYFKFKILYQKQLVLKAFFLLIYIILGLNGIKAQRTVEATFDVGANLPRTTQDYLSNSPYNFGYSGALEIAFHWKRIGLAIQTSYFNVNDQEFSITHNFDTYQSISTATNFRGKKSRVIALYLPLYIPVFYTKNLRFSLVAGLGLARFRESAFTWEIYKFSSINQRAVMLENTSLLALKVGFDITHRLSNSIALKYGFQRGYLSNIFSETIILYNFSAGVTYSILNKP